jgi:hypothetical protein
MKMTEKGLVDSSTLSNSSCKAFAKFVTEHMDDFINNYNSFRRLKEAVHLFVIIKLSI